MAIVKVHTITKSAQQLAAKYGLIKGPVAPPEPGTVLIYALSERPRARIQVVQPILADGCHEAEFQPHVNRWVIRGGVDK